MIHSLNSVCSLTSFHCGSLCFKKLLSNTFMKGQKKMSLDRGGRTLFANCITNAYSSGQVNSCFSMTSFVRF